MASLYSDAGNRALHWHQAALARLIAQSNPRGWLGYSTEAWALNWKNEALAARCSAHPELLLKLDRYETRAFCHRAEIDLDLRFYAALAYGGANVGRGRNNNWRVAASLPNLLPLLEELPTLTRAEAYERFRKLRSLGLLRGIGPSYFTKVMFFFGCPGAYILDQWLAKAILALRAKNWRIDAGGEFVFELVDGNGIRLIYPSTKGVHDSVSGLDYESFCLELEALAEKLRLSNGGEVERWLFSAHRSTWRQFLTSLDWTSPDTCRKAHYACT